MGHKIHLNVEPGGLVAVSEYLRKGKFWHKYLDGEILDGKVFTVYFGSHDLAKKLASQISRDLRPYLRQPIVKDEVEYAPNISGRFQVMSEAFEQYGFGLRGISILTSWAKDKITYWTPQAEKAKRLPLAFDDSYKAMADLYGEYFYGR
jgi:hypothetical protein